jgi:hypothetical protein
VPPVHHLELRVNAASIRYKSASGRDNNTSNSISPTSNTTEPTIKPHAAASESFRIKEKQDKTSNKLASSAMPWGQPAKNILIIGATGVIGTYITRAIVDAKQHFGRICVLTSEKTVIEKVQDICALESWGVEVFVGRLEDEKRVKEAYKGQRRMTTCYQHELLTSASS